MKFWLFMLVMDLLIPGVMIGFGLRYARRNPGEINRFCGYRTPRSMASREAWEHAHRLLGRIWLWGGVGLAIPTVVALVALLGLSEDTVGLWGGAVCVVQTLLMLLSILPIEMSLARTFDRNGNRKNK